MGRCGFCGGLATLLPLVARKMCKERLTPAAHLTTRAFGQAARQSGEDRLQRPMLHRSIAECSLWKGRQSCGEAAGQLRRGCGGPGGAGTWPRAVFGAAKTAPGPREDLLESLHKMAEWSCPV